MFGYKISRMGVLVGLLGSRQNMITMCILLCTRDMMGTSIHNAHTVDIIDGEGINRGPRLIFAPGPPARLIRACNQSIN